MSYSNHRNQLRAEEVGADVDFEITASQTGYVDTIALKYAGAETDVTVNVKVKRDKWNDTLCFSSNDYDSKGDTIVVALLPSLYLYEGDELIIEQDSGSECTVYVELVK